jgi:hypothetical protein
VVAVNEQTIKEYIPASWFHPVGIFKVLARIWDRLPDVSGKLFLTFTVDPKNYASEESAFKSSRDWLRKVFFQLRHGVEHEGETYDYGNLHGQRKSAGGGGVGKVAGIR